MRGHPYRDCPFCFSLDFIIFLNGSLLLTIVLVNTGTQLKK